MQYVRLGNSSLKLSRLGLGAMGFGDTSWRSWVLDLDASRAVFRRAIDAGMNFIDTCDYYSAGVSEQIVGTLVAEHGNRSSLVIATKVGNPMGRDANARGYSRKHIIEAAEQSLRRLHTDYIDIYQTHIWDPTTNLEEMMHAFDHLVRAGKVLYIGITDMPCWQFATAQFHAERHSLAKFVSVQNHYNLLWREDERELLPFCWRQGIGLIPYSPMARGFLCERARRVDPTRTERAKTDDYTYKLYGRPADEAVVDRVAEVAAERGVTPAQIALAWVLHQPGITAPIIGATQPAHVDQAIAALELQLNAEELRRLQEPYLPRP
ncbi:MAG TPA: aldo/keto reductase [Acetobacteraceae bacterium]|jgi:aryl-alcohol dehydrogenase-like predicted oxidoreductase|nr:aldo/keto reductase [Acetobacteraceae bacterium]